MYLANSQVPVPVPVPRYHRLYLTPSLPWGRGVECHFEFIFWSVSCTCHYHAICDIVLWLKCSKEFSFFVPSWPASFSFLYKGSNSRTLIPPLHYVFAFEVTVNSLRPGDAMWCNRTWSTLVQVMAWCLMAPSHYLNQCRLIIKYIL